MYQISTYVTNEVDKMLFQRSSQMCCDVLRCQEIFSFRVATNLKRAVPRLKRASLGEFTKQGSKFSLSDQ